MNTSKNLIRSYYSEMDQLKGDYSQMANFFHHEMQFHFPGIPHPMPVGQFQAVAQGIYSGFPDFKHTVENVIQEGDVLSCRLNINGTHQGEFQGIPATNRSIAISAITQFRVQDDQIVDHWISVDMLGLLKQIGAMN